MELSYAKLSGILWYILHQKKLAVRYDQQSVILHQKKLAVRYDQQSETVEIFSDNSKQIFPFLQIECIQHKEGIFWSSLSIKALDEQECRIKGLPKSKTKKFFHSLQNTYELYWKEFLQSNDRLIQHLANQASDFDAGKFFMSNSMAQKIMSEIKRLGFPLPLPINILNDRQSQDIQILNRFINNFDRQRINQKFIPLELERFKTFFDNIEANPLTEKQRLAVIVNEDANLVVAGAGSGKTSIIIAKAAYILKKGLCNQSEILLLTYSNKAKKELEQRLEQRIDNRINKHISVKTFHSLGLDIITAVHGTPPPISNLATDSMRMTKKLTSIIEEQMSDPYFKRMVVRYFSSFFGPYKTQFQFQTMGEYYAYIKSHGIRTLSSEFVKSFEECEIANFLYLHGVKYEYEKPYEYKVNAPTCRQYQPDFFLSDYQIYIEHFGIDRKNRTAPFIDQEKYLKEIEWKRTLHKTKGTILIETFSYEKKEGRLLPNLKEKLQAYDVELNLIPKDKIFDCLNKAGQANGFVQLVTSFLNHFRSNKLNIEMLKSMAQGHNDKERLITFLEIFQPILDAYEKHLTAHNEIDFNDMITQASEYVETNRYQSPFLYILVDEFQDISTGRAKLIQALKNHQPLSSLFCVGDDWQSIYRFAGSEISIFKNFEQEFGCTEKIILDQTFRLNNQICDFSSKFILANPHQLPKNIQPKVKVDTPRIFIAYEDQDEGGALLDKVIAEIAQMSDEQEKKVLLLGRYNHNWKKPEQHHLDRLCESHKNLKIEFMTVHKSKGQEANFVIMLGLCSGRSGFPTEITDDPILELVLAEPEDFNNAEERRLFYVAVTRAREAVFLLANKTRPSGFISEIEEGEYTFSYLGDGIREIERCPQCKTGLLIRRKGKPKDFFSCSNYPYCDFLPPTCPECKNGALVEIDTGEYVCTNKECTYKAWRCLRCKKNGRDGMLISRTNKKNGNQFWGCTSYPECKYTKPIFPN